MEERAGMLRALDDSPLSRRYWILAIAVMLGAILDLFDFFLIAFVVPVVSDEWSLTFGQAATVLLSAGVGSIVGSVVWGRLGDRYGRRRPLAGGIMLFSLATGALALSPEGGWWYMTFFRFLVGAGFAGVAVIAVPFVLEFTPTRLRTKLVGFLTTAMVPIGVLMAAVASGTLIPIIGWRPLFVIGLLPVLLAVFVIAYVPESPRWLLDRGRPEDARHVIAWLLHRAESDIPLEAPEPLPEQGTSYRDLLRYRPSLVATGLAWFGASVAVSGLVLWGPTFLELVLEIEPERAAILFAFVTLGSFAGRLFFSFAPVRTGRRFCGALMGFGAAPLLVLAAFSEDAAPLGVSLFLFALVLAAFFVDGGFANLAPYTSEVYPTRMRTQGMGAAWMLSGLGRIVGPLGVALIAGTSNLVEPEATMGALKPAFIFLAGSSLLVGFAFWAVKLEPHGRDLEQIGADLVEATRVTVPAIDPALAPAAEPSVAAERPGAG